MSEPDEIPITQEKSGFCGSIKCHILLFFIIVLLIIFALLVVMIVFNPFHVNCPKQANDALINCTSALALTNSRIDNASTTALPVIRNYGTEEVNGILTAMKTNAALYKALVPALTKTYPIRKILDAFPGRSWKLRSNVVYDNEAAEHRSAEAIMRKTANRTDFVDVENIVNLLSNSSVGRFMQLKERMEEGDRPSKRFDSREEWPFCQQIAHVYDQAGCGSCWAVNSASAITDRTCIANRLRGDKKAKDFTDRLSSFDTTTCQDTKDGGSMCFGGASVKAYYRWLTDGLVTEECLPYPIKPNCGSPCGSLHSLDPENLKAIREATSVKCTRGSEANLCHHTHLKPIKYKGTEIYSSMFASSVFPDRQDRLTAIKLDIEERGPGTICFNALLDLMYYGGGIYTHLAGDFVYGHCVKVIGWGDEENTPYWIISNSWGISWGENGFGRMNMNDKMFNEGFYFLAGVPEID